MAPVVSSAPIPKRRAGTSPSLASSSRSSPASPSADGDRGASSMVSTDRPSDHKVSLDNASQSTGHSVVKNFAHATYPTVLTLPRPPAPVREKYRLGSEALHHRLPNLKARKRDNGRARSHRGPVWGLEVSVPSPVYEQLPVDQGSSITSPASTDSSSHPKSPDISYIAQVVDHSRCMTYELPITNNTNLPLDNQPKLVDRAATKDEVRIKSKNTKQIQEEEPKEEPEQASGERKQGKDGNPKRKESHGIDTSHSTKPITPPLSSEDTSKRQPKGKKRAREENEEAQTPTKKTLKTTSLRKNNAEKPRNKAKASSPSRTLPGGKPQRKPIALPRAMQASTNKGPSSKSTDVEMRDVNESTVAQPPRKAIKRKPVGKPRPAPRRRTRSTLTAEKSEDKHIGDADQASEDDLGDNDFVVEDIKYRPKKSKVGAMARLMLFAGMR